jgi:hypothetical protein
MQTRKQLRGNCQCCGRQQAVLGTGRISKHGYTVENHWFSGVCSGEHHAPLQKDRTEADRIVAAVRAECDELEQLANAYKVGIAHPARIDKPSYRRGEDPTIAWEDAAEWQQKDGIKSAIYRLESRANGGRGFADMLEQLANGRHGQPLVEAQVETSPAPIQYGEKRKAPNGKVLKVVKLVGQRVYWKDERGFGSWTGSSAWRRYELASN